MAAEIVPIMVEDGQEGRRISAPRTLSPDSRRFWRRVTRDFVLESHDLELLRLACEALDRGAEARARILADGAYIPGRTGLRAHPAVGIERDSAIRAARLLRELGLSLDSPATSRPPTRWR